VLKAFLRASFVLLGCAAAAAQDVTPRIAEPPAFNAADDLDQTAARFSSYSDDLLTFATGARADSEHIEYDVAISLANEATLMSERLHSLSALLSSYNVLACKEDRAKMKPLLAREFTSYRDLFMNSVKVINFNMTYTHRPTVAAEAPRMRDDVRAMRVLLDMVTLN
jgi:hypothetical protein